MQHNEGFLCRKEFTHCEHVYVLCTHVFGLFVVCDSKCVCVCVFATKMSVDILLDLLPSLCISVSLYKPVCLGMNNVLLCFP